MLVAELTACNSSNEQLEEGGLTDSLFGRQPLEELLRLNGQPEAGGWVVRSHAMIVPHL